jgi:hypothetical protein
MANHIDLYVGELLILGKSVIRYTQPIWATGE